MRLSGILKDIPVTVTARDRSTLGVVVANPEFVPETTALGVSRPLWPEGLGAWPANTASAALSSPSFARQRAQPGISHDHDCDRPPG